MSSTTTPASFKHRALASIIDFSVMWLLCIAGLYIAASQKTLADSVLTVFYLVLLLLNPIIIFRDIILIHYFGGSIGKLLSGLRIVSEHNDRLSFKRIFFRSTVGYSFSSLFFGLGFLSVIKDARKQAWHDKAVGSQVIVQQQLWPLGLVSLIGIIAAMVLLTVSGFRTLVSGPLPVEIKAIGERIQAENDERISPEHNKGLTEISSLVAKHEYEQARIKASALLQASSTKHEKASAYQSLGIIAYYDHDIPEALKHMYAAASLRPEDASILSWISVIENSRKNYPIAEKFAKEAVRLDSTEPNYAYMAALILYNEGQYVEAKSYLDKALEVYPDNQEYLDLQDALVKRLPVKPVLSPAAKKSN